MSYYLGLSVLKPPKGYVGKPIARIHVKRLSGKGWRKKPAHKRLFFFKRNGTCYRQAS